jgi:hypothetical protein
MAMKYGLVGIVPDPAGEKGAVHGAYYGKRSASSTRFAAERDIREHRKDPDQDRARGGNLPVRTRPARQPRPSAQPTPAAFGQWESAITPPRHAVAEPVR